MRVLDHGAGQTEHALDALGRDHIGRRPGGDDATLPHHHDAVGEARGLVASRGRIAFGSDSPRIGLVNQENHVFSGTLRADLTIAKPDATDDELHEALASAGASTWVSRLDEGLDTRIGTGGHSLTDSQRQQLALARVQLHDPDVLILDEAASEAGASREGELGDAATFLASRHTTITIAHRLDQAAAADTIVVLDEGRIVESGSHTDLLAREGLYRRLWDTWHDVRIAGE